jgi:hypothetical protein
MLSTSCLPQRSKPVDAPAGTQSVAPSRSGPGLQAGVVALVLSLSCLSALSSLPRANPAGTEPFALVFPPWTSAQAAAGISLSAGFRVLRSGAWPFVAIVTGPEDGLVAAPPAGALALKLAGLAGCLDSAVVGEVTP